ncbi:MAG: 23S rRNA (pseudouridine(1915)-N(3))-methyltransferase RlmH [Clostridiales bacterium]|jgi:23S rRNA (pseudouridine1915-N3)-methyltransferase|nr:23S rRNA (pseudouridine(1915)-N(3))-methyltransferase RlmH [Clostridiales bacterium]
MLNICLICVGRMREKHYISAFSEYEKRLKTYCKFELIELPEVRLPQAPSQAEIDAGLAKEAEEIEKRIPSGSYLIAMCIEGSQLSSSDFAGLIQKCANEGKSRICFVVGSSFGLDKCIKNRADFHLSMSLMTFPHHLARVMLAEQIYRGIMINEGSKYHK